MKTATIHSACECQARLAAELDEEKTVVRGWAKDVRRKITRTSPAHSIRPERARFEVGWFCPFCIRNTLRVFDTAALAYRDAEPASEPHTLPST